MRDPLIAPIFIVGAPRSGTSILGRMMAAHPTLCYSNEPRFVWRYGNDRRSDLLQASHLNPRIESHIRRHFTNLVQTGQGSRLLEKHPSNSLRMPFIHKIFPDARFVHIKRDGYESIASIRRFWSSRTQGLNYQRVQSNQKILTQRLREVSWSQLPFYASEFLQRAIPKNLAGKPLWGPRLPGMKSLVQELPILSVCALQWRCCVELATSYGRSDLPSHQYIEVNLPDLSRDRIKQLLEQLDLPPSGEVTDFFRADFHPNATRDKRDLFSADELKLVEPHVTAVSRYLEGG